jgi:hypothetical protein
MQENTSSPVVATLAEIVSDASGIPVSLIKLHLQLDADLGLSISQIEDLRYAAEFEFGIKIDHDEWLQNCDCIETIQALVGAKRHLGAVETRLIDCQLAA